MTKFRKERVSELLLAFLGEQVRRLGDSRLEFVTLTGVDISPDLKHARVYWTVLGSLQGDNSQGEEQGLIRETEEALRQTTAMLKKKIGGELKLRYTPEIVFRYDDSLQRGARIDQLLHQVK